MHGDDVASAGVSVSTQIVSKATEILLDSMANAYEEKFTEKNAPVEEAPEIEKPKPQKKPKL